MLKLLIAIVVLACIAPFFIKGKDGAYLMRLEDLFDRAGFAGNEVPAEKRGPEKLTVYKWQDAEGIWQFSSVAPGETAGVETLVLDGVINTIPALSPTGSGAIAEVTTADSQQSLPSLPKGVTTLAPEQVKELMDRVNNMQETVDERKASIDEGMRLP